MKPERITEGNAIEPWRQHLLDAAAYMEEHGICKGDMLGSDGSVCLLGAIFKTRDGRAQLQAVAAVERHLGRIVGPWNDRPETTKEMAVHALYAAALS